MTQNNEFLKKTEEVEKRCDIKMKIRKTKKLGRCYFLNPQIFITRENDYYDDSDGCLFQLNELQYVLASLRKNGTALFTNSLGTPIEIPNLLKDIVYGKITKIRIQIPDTKLGVFFEYIFN